MDETEWIDTQGLMALNARWIEHFFGARCEERTPGCECCVRWMFYDQLFRDGFGLSVLKTPESKAQ